MNEFVQVGDDKDLYVIPEEVIAIIKYTISGISKTKISLSNGRNITTDIPIEVVIKCLKKEYNYE